MTLLRITLQSDGCFAGWRPGWMADVDICQELDPLGLPRIGGRTLRGLLVEETSVLLRGLGERAGPWQEAAERVFGNKGAGRSGLLTLSDARWPEPGLRALEAAQSADTALAGLAARATTVLRRQTRIDPDTGAAADHSLRATRLARKGLVLEARLEYGGCPLGDPRVRADDRALIVCAARMVRRGGLHRTRGWGRLQCEVVEEGVSRGDWAVPLLQALAG